MVQQAQYNNQIFEVIYPSYNPSEIVKHLNLDKFKVETCPI